MWYIFYSFRIKGLRWAFRIKTTWSRVKCSDSLLSSDYNSSANLRRNSYQMNIFDQKLSACKYVSLFCYVNVCICWPLSTKITNLDHFIFSIAYLVEVWEMYQPDSAVYSRVSKAAWCSMMSFFLNIAGVFTWIAEFVLPISWDYFYKFFPF